MPAPTESDLESAALDWLEALGYSRYDPADDAPAADESDPDPVLLLDPLRAALRRLNPGLPDALYDEAERRLRRRDAPTLVDNNRAFHRLLTDGLTLEQSRAGSIRGVDLRLADFDAPENNDWRVAHQVTVTDRHLGAGQERIADIVVYLNGLPVAVFELKSPTGAANVTDAFHQFQTYKRDIPSLFVTNCALVIADGTNARIGSLTADLARFARWRTIDSEALAPDSADPLRVLIEGVFEHSRFLDLIRNFITFESQDGALVKKLAAYHQFHAVRRAVRETVRAASPEGDHKIGVVWHTQGSGKSLTMVFYARKLVLEPALCNPTLVLLTDRNDLDDQLFATFSQSQDLLRQQPVQTGGRAELRKLLQVASGGIVFTTIQMFLPEPGEKYPRLTDRRNVVVIADEAHRSQYGFKGRVNTKTGSTEYGFAKHLRDALPKASFIGFTGTPVELEDKNTVKVFGGYVSTYDIQRAVNDQATVPIYYENRLAKLDLDERERPRIDPRFEEVTEGEEDATKEALKTQWSALEAVVGTEKRLAQVAADLVAHFERRQATLQGKAMVVCMSRRICAELYEQIRKLRPHWHDDDDERGAMKVVITGSASDRELLQPHIRSKARRERLANRFKDAADPFKIVMVRDMWLTGFDAPCLHTLYVDKPMHGHNLMQAIARVNRVFGDKPGGLVVDYIGIGAPLKEALSQYARGGHQGRPTVDQSEAVAVMLEKLEQCRDVFHGFDYQRFFTGPPSDRLALLPPAREHVLKQRKPKEPPTAASGAPKAKSKKRAAEAPDAYDRFLTAAGELGRAFALAMPDPECERVRDEVAFFQAIRVGLAKLSATRRGLGDDVGHAVRQIVANAIVTEGVVDVFAAAGLPRPDISILSEQFLAEISALPHKNLAAELLQRLLQNEIRARRTQSIVQARRFSELLDSAVQRYLNRSVESAEVIQELIELAREMRSAGEQGKKLGLRSDEFAFYEALAANKSALEVLGDKQLAKIAGELTRLVRQNATIDWTLKRNVQAKLRAMVKRVLRTHGYPPDGQEAATVTVLEQAKVLGINVAAGAGEASAPVDGGAGTGMGAEPAAASAPRVYPYPIAVFDSLVQSQESAALRVKTRLDGIERALALLVAAEIETLRGAAGGALPAAVMEVVGKEPGKPVAMGTWLQYAWRLAAMLPAASRDPVVRAARTMVKPEGKPSSLALEIESRVVPMRNDFAHGVVAADAAVGDEELYLAEFWPRLKDALAPLCELELVSSVKATRVGTSGTHRYQVRMHQGSQEIFPLEERDVAGALEDQWCYLLGGEPGVRRIAPVYSCRFNKASERYELYVARALAFEKGAKLPLMGVASGSEVRGTV